MEIWRNTQEVAGAALARASLAPADLAAVGITNQRETTVLWDKRSGKPLHNALVWQDTRVDQLGRGIRPQWRRGSLPRQDRLAAGQLLQRPEVAMAAGQRTGRARQGRRRRTAVRHHRYLAAVESHRRKRWRPAPDRRHQRQPHATDESCNARLGRKPCWRNFGFRVPCCRASSPRAKSTARSRRRHWRAPASPVFSAISRRRWWVRPAFSRARRRTPTAPAVSCSMNTGEKPIASTAGLITTVAYQIGNEPACYALEGSIAITGALVQWLRDNLGMIAGSSEVEKLARDSCGQWRSVFRAGLLRAVCAALE